MPLDKNMQTGDIHADSSNGITFVKWVDNKWFIKYIFSVPTGTVKRTQAGTCPEVILCYNKHMGGVDLMDKRKAYYEVDRKGKIKYLPAPIC